MKQSSARRAPQFELSSCIYRHYTDRRIPELYHAQPGWGHQFMLQLHPKSIPIGTRRNAGVPLKKRAEKDDILIADGVTDFLHRAVIAL